jgi:hypothetical protein
MWRRGGVMIYFENFRGGEAFRSCVGMVLGDIFCCTY